MAEHEKGKKTLKDFIAGKEGDPTSFFNQISGGFNMPEPTPPTVNMPQMDSEEQRFNKMVELNGNTFENGERSQGDQEAEQRMVQNKATGLLQKFVGRFKDFLNRGPFPGSEDDPRTPTGSKLITGPDGKQYDENFIKTIPGGFSNMQEIERRRKIFEGM